VQEKSEPHTEVNLGRNNSPVESTRKFDDTINTSEQRMRNQRVLEYFVYVPDDKTEGTKCEGAYHDLETGGQVLPHWFF
jgi:hypothetical protein